MLFSESQPLFMISLATGQLSTKETYSQVPDVYKRRAKKRKRIQTIFLLFFLPFCLILIALLFPLLLLPR